MRRLTPWRVTTAWLTGHFADPMLLYALNKSIAQFTSGHGQALRRLWGVLP